MANPPSVRKSWRWRCIRYLSGVPHRINHVRRAFEEVLSQQAGVAAWDGANDSRLVSGTDDVTGSLTFRMISTHRCAARRAGRCWG